MFVPKLTREGARALDNRHFVATQLMHYGIEVDEKDFKGRGTALLKKAVPDRTKTTTVDGVPLPWSRQYRSQCVIEAASKVPGLIGPDTQMIYLGWDAAAVDKAAKGHAAKGQKGKAGQGQGAREGAREGTASA